MTIDRRALIGLGVAATAGLAVRRADAQIIDALRWPPAESFILWPALPPGAPNPLPRPNPRIAGRPGEYQNLEMRGVAMPTVGVFRPARPDGRAVLVCPGGGYAFTSLRGEGIDVAARLLPAGITVFVLSYRLPGEGWADRANVPLADAQRAMRLIRASANRYRIDPRRLGVLGFSAGGHLAGSLVTQHEARVYTAVDAADRQSARPAFGGLIYAVSNMDAGRSHGGSRAMLLGPAPARGMEARYAPERNLRPGSPPLFLLHCEDDTVVPVANTLDTLASARAMDVPTEALLFSRGGHGFGVRVARTNPASLWPEMFERWTAGIR